MPMVRTAGFPSTPPCASSWALLCPVRVCVFHRRNGPIPVNAIAEHTRPAASVKQFMAFTAPAAPPLPYRSSCNKPGWLQSVHVSGSMRQHRLRMIKAGQTPFPAFLSCHFLFLIRSFLPSCPAGRIRRICDCRQVPDTYKQPAGHGAACPQTAACLWTPVSACLKPCQKAFLSK